MKILNLTRRLIPHSLTMQMQAFNNAEVVEVIHEEPTQRELTPFEFKKVCQMQAWASRQHKLIYDELNPTVKEARK